MCHFSSLFYIFHPKTISFYCYLRKRLVLCTSRVHQLERLTFWVWTLVYRHGRTGVYRTHLFGSPSIIVCTPETCRKVLTDEEQLKLGYPASTMALTGKRSFHGISNAEHRRLRRLTTAPINGHDALSMYIGLIEGIAVKQLEELSSMERPCEFLTEMRKFAFEVITTIFVASESDGADHHHHHHVDLGLVENLYTDLNRGIKSLAINLPGFAFHKALKVNIN